jgi:predicted nucleic acid-binding Zn ribbon protein
MADGTQMPEGYDGPERRQLPDLKTELRGVKTGLEELVLAVKMAFPEDRVREIVAYEQARTRRRTIAAILGPLLLALVVVFVQSRLNGETLAETKVTSNFVRDCLQDSDDLTPEERQKQCGDTGGGGDGVATAVRVLINHQNCALLIRPADRTDENMNACVSKALDGLGG